MEPKTKRNECSQFLIVMLLDGQPEMTETLAQLRDGHGAPLQCVRESRGSLQADQECTVKRRALQLRFLQEIK